MDTETRRPADAIACLQPIYDRFTEGFGTADLIAAHGRVRIGENGRQADRGVRR